MNQKKWYPSRSEEVMLDGQMRFKIFLSSYPLRTLYVHFAWTSTQMLMLLSAGTAKECATNTIAIVFVRSLLVIGMCVSKIKVPMPHNSEQLLQEASSGVKGSRCFASSFRLSDVDISCAIKAIVPQTRTHLRLCAETSSQTTQQQTLDTIKPP